MVEGGCSWKIQQNKKYEVMVHESQTYASLMDLVRTRYSVGAQTAVALTYEFPEWMRVSGDIATPPGDVKEDGYVDLFMGIRLEIPDLRLLVTIGNNVVARYLFKRRDNYTVKGSSTGAVAPMCYSFRGSNAANDPAFGYVLIYMAGYLMERLIGRACLLKAGC